MSMADKVRSEMVAAMKNKEKDRKDALSMLLSALKNKAIDKRADLTREDIKEACEKRLAVYQEFAPEEMSEEAVLAEVKAVLAALAIDAPSMKDKGKVMKELMPRVKGRADGGMVNKIVGEVLNGEK